MAPTFDMIRAAKIWGENIPASFGEGQTLISAWQFTVPIGCWWLGQRSSAEQHAQELHNKHGTALTGCPASDHSKLIESAELSHSSVEWQTQAPKLPLGTQSQTL